MDDTPFPERLRTADLDRYLATLYAPAETRAALFALHALDLELAEVVRTTTQPMVGLIRLAWWREALQRLDTAPPPAQPLLAALATSVLPRGVTGAMLAGIEEGFAALLEDPVDITTYARERGSVFELAARLAGEDAERAGEAGALWAAGELLRLKPDIDRALLATFAKADTKGAPRPLRALAALARSDLAHGPARRGGPSRQLRLLWSILRPGL